jgi:hypothetical protein
MPTEQPSRSRGRKTPAERQSYTLRRAERTAGKKGEKATSHRSRWTIDDARTALDLSLSVPEIALRLGRTASAVEGLRAKWRSGALPLALADQLPPYRPADAHHSTHPGLEAGDE